ncbi:MAG: hypothetical protein JRH11_03290 [Deltaproteobacteria bacterium]|nr:hypothetical protein [Deltaproteobacteria bacterium]
MTFRRASPALLLPLLWAALLAALVAGCGGEASPLAWTIIFEDPTEKASTAVVATRVLEGGCAGSTQVYFGTIDLRTSSAAPQPDELGEGTYGFLIEARSLDCVITDSTCDEHTLPLEAAEVVSTFSGDGGAGSACAPGQECDGNGNCVTPIMPDAMMPRPCEGEGTACGEGGVGICRSDECCLGCWTGTSCERGTTTAACGAGGALCTSCDTGDTCGASSCVTTSTDPQFSLSATTNIFKAEDGAYWANGDDGIFMQLGPVAAAGGDFALRGYTGALRFADVAAAQVATAAIEAGTGDLYTWGTNAAGALGAGSNDFGRVDAAPNQIVTLDTWLSVASGDTHFCAIRSDDTLWCWGKNTDGQLGTGDNTFRSVPAQVGSSRWISVSAFFDHTCGIRDDRSLHCWGKNVDGRLGDGSTTDKNSPSRVGTANDWSVVATGVGHTCGIRVTGGARRLYCWGRTNSGVLGIGDTTGTPNVNEPTEVRADFTTWQTVTAGQFHTCALIDLMGGGLEALCWGFGGFGATGIGSMDQSNVPTPVDIDPAAGWTSISAGLEATCGVQGGIPYCWGDSTDGWLGIGITGDTATSPTAVLLNPAP